MQGEVFKLTVAPIRLVMDPTDAGRVQVNFPAFSPTFLLMSFWQCRATKPAGDPGKAYKDNMKI